MGELPCEQRENGEVKCLAVLCGSLVAGYVCTGSFELFAWDAADRRWSFCHGQETGSTRVPELVALDDTGILVFEQDHLLLFSALDCLPVRVESPASLFHPRGRGEAIDALRWLQGDGIGVGRVEARAEDFGSDLTTQLLHLLRGGVVTERECPVSKVGVGGCYGDLGVDDMPYESRFCQADRLTYKLLSTQFDVPFMKMLWNGGKLPRSGTLKGSFWKAKTQYRGKSSAFVAVSPPTFLPSLCLPALEGAVNDCPEYIVFFDAWEKLAREYGLELVMHANYQEFARITKSYSLPNTSSLFTGFFKLYTVGHPSLACPKPPASPRWCLQAIRPALARTRCCTGLYVQ
ncbi:hypothetical protein SELMODRAFT_415328 [Selaginella moellendorffii]|uniref:mRNA cap 0 methyltransferase domain-containing protein n=1 Tax=Selaginella moellendorffii TaxID=88036 RepID=D8RVS2_SELML|nr:hypothetical protein SELMODRAFT_415328 [Selaginella moellendorffii]